jgi:excinuclease ABC subunit B
MAHNAEHGLTPRTVFSGVKDVLEGVTSKAAQGLLPRGRDPNKRLRNIVGEDGEDYISPKAGHNLARVIEDMEKDMREAAANLEFEEAARLRDEVKKLRDTEIGLVETP